MTAGAVFEREILEQAEVTRAQGAGLLEPVRRAAAAIAERGPAGFVIAARGTSDHAATYAKYLLEMRNHTVVSLAAPSAFSLYHEPPRVEQFCVIGISQSGASVDVCSVVEEARRQGALTLALTNNPASRLAAAADQVLPLSAGEERSVPASKTYTATLYLLAMLSDALTPDPEFGAGLERVPDAIQQVLNGWRSGDAVTRLVDVLDAPRLAVLGRGFHLATAQEIALKIMETSYAVAEARSVADFQHGPLAIIEPGFPVLLLEAGGPALDEMRALAGQLGELGARVAQLTDQPGDGPLVWALPLGLPEPLTPIPFAVAGQLLALAIARRRGYDPDQPRSLHKVTITR
ncbi:MAG: SIS domain-containing protein [Candidatus Dormibacteraeota bacterium]|nr:SIS domain-containing protein [Candidatus Dormibacteraeota bacterium]